MEMNEEKVKYVLTPKGFLTVKLLDCGVNEDEASNIWHMLEAFCFKTIKRENPDANYAAIVFDGNGGEVVGLDCEVNE